MLSACKDKTNEFHPAFWRFRQMQYVNSVMASNETGSTILQTVIHRGLETDASASTGASDIPAKMCNAADRLSPTHANALAVMPATASEVDGPP
ncbi:MAG: hypothetical protein ROO76_00530 [Terriglobia bacterium]|jgi:hypothetical protein|nr:hypothetical protein [Terriglobia bacterium]